MIMDSALLCRRISCLRLGHEAIVTDRFSLSHPTINVQMPRRMLRPTTRLGRGSAECSMGGQLIISICRVQGQGERAPSYCGRRQWFVCWDANHSPGASLDAVSALSRLRLALQERQPGPSANERGDQQRDKRASALWRFAVPPAPNPRRWGGLGCAGDILDGSDSTALGSRGHATVRIVPGALNRELGPSTATNVRLPGTSVAFTLLLLELPILSPALKSWSNSARQPTHLLQLAAVGTVSLSLRTEAS